MSQAFELPAELTIYSVMETRDALLAWAEKTRSESPEPLEVNAAAVQQVDGAGLQLLASLAATDANWRLTQPSAVLTEACQTMGLARWLDSAHADAGGTP